MINKWPSDSSNIFSSMTEFNAAGGAAANLGVNWVGGVQYWSDGIAIQKTSIPKKTPVVLYDGDSITRRSESIEPSTNFELVNVHTGISSGGYATWEKMFLNNSFIKQNNAVSGETIQQITARILTTDLTDVSVVSVMMGMNNITSGATIEDLLPYFIQVIEYITSKGIPLRILTVTPRDTSVWDATAKALYLDINNAIRKFPQQYPLVFVGDAAHAIQSRSVNYPEPQGTPGTATYMLNENGSYAATGTHPGVLASVLIAQETYSSLRDALYAAGYSTLPTIHEASGSPVELLPNTNFSVQTGGQDSTGGILTGTVPSGWRILPKSTPSAITISYPYYIPNANKQMGNWVTGSTYTIGDGVTESGIPYLCLAEHTAGTFATDLSSGNWIPVLAKDYCIQFDVTTTAAGQGLDIRLQTPANLDFKPNDTICQSCEVTNLPGTASMYRAQIRVAAKDYANTVTHDDSTPYEQNNVSNQAIPGLSYKLKGLTLALAVNDSNGHPDGFFIYAVSASAGTFSVVFANPSLVKYT